MEEVKSNRTTLLRQRYCVIKGHGYPNLQRSYAADCQRGRCFVTNIDPDRLSLTNQENKKHASTNWQFTRSVVITSSLSPSEILCQIWRNSHVILRTYHIHRNESNICLTTWKQYPCWGVKMVWSQMWGQKNIAKRKRDTVHWSEKGLPRVIWARPAHLCYLHSALWCAISWAFEPVLWSGNCAVERMCVQSVAQMVLGWPATASSLDWDLFLCFMGEFFILFGQLSSFITSSWECTAHEFLSYSDPRS